MSGPEHYREAEGLLAQVNECPDHERAQSWIAEAQVHATLALAAATAWPSPADISWPAGEYA